MRSSSGAALVLVLLLAVPGAGAFPSASAPVSIVYDGEMPALIGAGALRLDGSVSTALLVAGASTTRLERVPHLVLVERSGSGPRETQLRDATLEVHSGALLLLLPGNTTLAVGLAAPYAVGLALPQAPVPSASGAPGPGFLLASEHVAGSASWSGPGQVEVVPFDAVVTLRDVNGTPYDDWASRAVNRGATAASDPDGLSLVLRAEGAFQARVGGTLVGGATGAPAAATLRVDRADEDRFAQTATSLGDTASTFFGEGDPFSQQGGPLEVLGQASGVLNGALLLVPGGIGEDVEPIAPRESLYGGEPFDLGPLAILRGEMDVAWTPTGEMRVSGEPSLALGREGFRVAEPLSVGVFPVLALVLWAFAIGAIVWFFLRRPPKGAHSLPLRMLSLGAWLVVLAGVFYLWDRGFEESFGTGVVSTLRAEGVTPDSLPTLGLLLALELVPWSIAALLFGLPVRIVLGVALRRFGRGKSFKGLASAGGLVALGLLGPSYALWCFNLVWSRVATALGA